MTKPLRVGIIMRSQTGQIKKLTPKFADILQIDGLGGSRPITSKVAIISRTQRADADVEYTFAQVEIECSQVSYIGNCGNISSGVGRFVSMKDWSMYLKAIHIYESSILAQK